MSLALGIITFFAVSFGAGNPGAGLVSGVGVWLVLKMLSAAFAALSGHDEFD